MTQADVQIPFFLVNAFTDDTFKGNPAGVIFLEREISSEMMMKIASNLNQPATAFVRPMEHKDKKNLSFSIRWFSPAIEIVGCGHATIATTKAILASPHLASDLLETITFYYSKGVLLARREGEWISLKMLPATIKELSSDESSRIKGVIHKAFGREVPVLFVGTGGERFPDFLLVELDERVDLKNCVVNFKALEATGFMVNVVTTASTGSEEGFVSRMFAPLAGLPEDHVCGSAHCLLGPYWSEKRGVVGDQILAKQVSPRGGDLKVTWDKEHDALWLKGEAKIVIKGELTIQID